MVVTNYQLFASKLGVVGLKEPRRLTHIELLILDDFVFQPLDATQTTDFYELIVATVGAIC